MSHRLILLVIAIASAPCVATAAERTWQARFEARYGPFRIADLTLTATEDDTRYSAAGTVLRTTLISLIRDFHFDLRVEGRRNGADFTPDRFFGDLDTGHRQVRVEMHYDRGVPVIDRLAPEEPQRAYSLEAANQGGTVDMLTALFRVARPRPVAELCGWSVDLFDGRRRSRLVLEPARTQDGESRCQGEYRRLAGYAPQDLEDYDHMPFVVTFRPDAAGNWLLTRIDTQTPYGRMRILRLN